MFSIALRIIATSFFLLLEFVKQVAETELLVNIEKHNFWPVKDTLRLNFQFKTHTFL